MVETGAEAVEAVKTVETEVEITEGIYEFTSKSGKTYVGQSGNIAERIEQHVASGKLLPKDLSSVKITEVLGGKTAREIAEQLRINELGGVRNLENILNPIGKGTPISVATSLEMIGNVQLERGEYGLRGIVKSEWSDDIAKYLIDHAIVELELNDGKGWRGANLNFLLFPVISESIRHY